MSSSVQTRVGALVIHEVGLAAGVRDRAACRGRRLAKLRARAARCAVTYLDTHRRGPGASAVISKTVEKCWSGATAYFVARVCRATWRRDPMDIRPLNFRTLDLNLLKVFDVVMVERNVTRAAARLAMTQPAVSNALKRLRESAHEELFVPTSTGVTPTPHAEALWPVVRTALEALRDAFVPQAFDPAADARSFTIAMADATAALFVPALASHLPIEAPHVDLGIVALTTRDPRAMLEHGQADAAVGFFPDVTAALAADGARGVMARERLYGCEYVCAMRHDHPLAADGALTLDAYCAAQHLRVSFAGRPNGFVDEALTRLGRERRVVITVEHFFTAGAVVQQSDLITVLPRSFVPATGFESRLAMRPPPFTLPRIDVAMLWHRRHDTDAAQQWLRATLARVAAQIAPAC